jgi:hypothetical protein
MHLLGVLDFLRCITLIYCVLVYFNATLWAEIQRA